MTLFCQTDCPACGNAWIREYMQFSETCFCWACIQNVQVKIDLKCIFNDKFNCSKLRLFKRNFQNCHIHSKHYYTGLHSNNLEMLLVFDIGKISWCCLFFYKQKSQIQCVFFSLSHSHCKQCTSINVIGQKSQGHCDMMDSDCFCSGPLDQLPIKQIMTARVKLFSFHTHKTLTQKRQACCQTKSKITALMNKSFKIAIKAYALLLSFPNNCESEKYSETLSLMLFHIPYAVMSKSLRCCSNFRDKIG